jgi:hypothetical protein
MVSALPLLKKEPRKCGALPCKTKVRLATGAITTVATKFWAIQVDRNTIPLVGTVVAVPITNPSFRTTISIAIFDFTSRTSTTVTGAIAAVTIKLVAI